MRHALAFFALFIMQQCFAQCPFAVTLTANGNLCTGNTTLAVIAPNAGLTTITWYNGSIPDTTVKATKVAVANVGVTVAGGNGRGAAANQFNLPNSIFVDGGGYLYVSDITNNRIQKFPPGSTSATYGQTAAGSNGIGPATNQLQPNAVYIDGSGYLYGADNANARILRFPPGSDKNTFGTTVAGDNGQGKAANQFVNPVSVDVDVAGNMYVIDAQNNRLQEFPPNSTGATNAVTIAGSHGYGPGSDQFNGPACVHVDSLGNIFVADAANNRIQKFGPGATDAITVAGGNGFGAALNQLSTPSSVWVDGNGFIYVADVNNERIQKFPPGSTSATLGKTVAGGNGAGSGPNQFSGPNSVCVDGAGNIYVSDAGNNRIQKFSQSNDSISVIDTVYTPTAPGSYTAVVTGSNGCADTTNIIVVGASVQPAVSINASANSPALCNAQALDTINFTASITNGGASPVYQWQVNGIAQGTNNAFFTAALAAKDVVTCALTSNAACASPSSVTSNGYAVPVTGPPVVTLTSKGSACAGEGTLIVNSNSSISTIVWYNGNVVDTTVTSSSGIQVATNGVTVAGGNGLGPAANQFFHPSAVYVDGGGNMYIADQFNYRVQKFPPGSTAATSGQTIAGGNGEGTANNQMQPVALYGDADGYMYVADHESFRILKFLPGSTSLTKGLTVAGGNGQGSAPNQFNAPTGVAIDGGRNIYVADGYNARIQKFPPNSDSLTNGVTIAGGNGYGAATNQFVGPYALFVDRYGTTYVADYGNSRILKFPPGSTRTTMGVVVAGGNGQGPGPNQLSLPFSVFVDSSGNIYVDDEGNNRIQKFPPFSNSSTNGITVAGGNGRGAAANQLDDPLSVWVDGSGSIYVADAANQRIQKFNQPTLVIDTTLIAAKPGTYFAVVTSSPGCTDTTNAIVINPSQTSVVSINAAPDSTCAGGKVVFNATAVNAGLSPAYQWLINGAPFGTNSTSYTTDSLANGDAIVCAVTGGPGCFTTDTSNRVIATVWPQPVVGPAGNISILPGQSIPLNIPVTGNIVAYLWQPANGLSSSNVAAPVASPLQTTDYTLKVVSANGCIATGPVTVFVSSPIHIPGAFTPNGDGRNDVFYVIGGNPGDKIKDFAVYGRWGQQLFHAQNILPGDATNGWNGTYNGLQQPPGAYVYVAAIVSADGTEKIFKGTVVLIR